MVLPEFPYRTYVSPKNVTTVGGMGLYTHPEAFQARSVR